MATSTDLRSAIEEVKRQMPADVAEPGRGGDPYAPDALTRMEHRLGALPWWAISAVVHAVIFLLATLLTVAMPPAQVDEVIISTDVAKEQEKTYDEKLKRDIFKQNAEIKHEQEVEKPVLVHEEVEVTDHFETDNDMDNQSARGSEDAISDIPLGGTGVTGSIGVGGGGMAGVYGYRDGGGRKRAVARFGGSPATESAVEAALRWLARNQEADGHWEITRHLPEKSFSKNRPNPSYVPGVTGLALLAFLGAGYTHKVQSPYRESVLKAVNWMIQQQNDDGTFAKRHSHSTYSEFICCLAISEAYGMTKDERLKEVAQKSVDWALKTQTPYSGWRYHRKNDSDTSVVGWALMALKSAKMAGLKVDGSAFQGITTFLDKVTVKGDDGTVQALYRPQEKVSSGFESDTRCCTAIAMLCRQFLGAKRDNPQVSGSADWLAGNVPEWSDRNARVTHFYYWYYGTLAMFQVGGERWNKWNEAQKKVLLDNQRKGGPEDGSWDPKCYYGHHFGGRAYNTALGALTLEVYYRYLPLYAK
ncbi:MAG: prenyltransferase/squalene oxidase repeat-containing protein [Planctomycetota bacterium]|jgi:hypothetical protein